MFLHLASHRNREMKSSTERLKLEEEKERLSEKINSKLAVTQTL